MGKIITCQDFVDAFKNSISDNYQKKSTWQEIIEQRTKSYLWKCFGSSGYTIDTNERCLWCGFTSAASPFIAPQYFGQIGIYDTFRTLYTVSTSGFYFLNKKELNQLFSEDDIYVPLQNFFMLQK